jgi:hypothetical protein
MAITIHGIHHDHHHSPSSVTLRHPSHAALLLLLLLSCPSNCKHTCLTSCCHLQLLSCIPYCPTQHISSRSRQRFWNRCSAQQLLLRIWLVA